MCLRVTGPRHSDVPEPARTTRGDSDTHKPRTMPRATIPKSAPLHAGGIPHAAAISGWLSYGCYSLRRWNDAAALPSLQPGNATEPWGKWPAECCLPRESRWALNTQNGRCWLSCPVDKWYIVIFRSLVCSCHTPYTCTRTYFTSSHTHACAFTLTCTV